MTLTTETITDEQIAHIRQGAQLAFDHEQRWWRDNRCRSGRTAEREHKLILESQRETMKICDVALGKIKGVGYTRDDARARIAIAINARRDAGITVP